VPRKHTLRRRSNSLAASDSQDTRSGGKPSAATMPASQRSRHRRARDASVAAGGTIFEEKAKWDAWGSMPSPVPINDSFLDDVEVEPQTQDHNDADNEEMATTQGEDADDQGDAGKGEVKLLRQEEEKVESDGDSEPQAAVRPTTRPRRR
jgi:hypothetical protein